jgi:AcrR family transcriptional regulator
VPTRIAASERRSLLVDAALAVAERDGVPAMSVRRVADEAGVSLGLVHYCFSDKDDLVVQVAARIVAELAAAGEQRLAAVEGGTLEQALLAGVRGLWTVLTATARRQLVTYEITTHALRHPGLRDVAREQYAVSQTAVEDFLTHAARTAGARWARPVGELAALTLAVIDGVTLRWLVDDDRAGALARLEDFARTLARDSG